MQAFMVKVGHVPRRANQLVGIYQAGSIDELERLVGSRFSPELCKYLPLSKSDFALDLVGRIRPKGKVYVDKAYVADSFVDQIVMDECWLTFDNIKKTWDVK